MDESELITKITDLTEKLNKAQRQVAGFKARSKVLSEQYTDSRTRENNTTQLVMELLERQRELNVMLNRANIMLNHAHEAMALSSVELNEMAKALPEPKKAEWADRVAKINDLFKKTGIQDAELASSSIPSLSAGDSLSADELRRESEQAFGTKDSIWNRKEQREPPQVEPEIVEEDETPPQHADLEQIACEGVVTDAEPAQSSENDAASELRRKSWWQKIAG